MAHEHASLVDIQKWAGVLADTPLFQSLLVYDKFRENAPSLNDQQIQCTAHSGVNFTEYPLTAAFAVVGDRLALLLEYNTNVYDSAYLAFVGDLIDTLLTQMLHSTPATTLKDATLLSGSELATITTWSQGTTATYDSKCLLLHDAFLHNLAIRPDCFALESNGQRWTYAQVHHEARIVASWLMRQGHKVGYPVALVFSRSPEYIFSVLAVLLTGGIYVPIDAQVTATRIRDVLNDLDNPLIISVLSHIALLKELACDFKRVGFCDEILQLPRETDLTHPCPRLSTDSLAYIIFTSGTT
ncbi:hypothetical protein H4R34_006231, partial [Dimargaris verticillata]